MATESIDISENSTKKGRQNIAVVEMIKIPKQTTTRNIFHTISKAWKGERINDAVGKSK